MAEIVDLADAVRDLVHDGQTVALEGFTHLIPLDAGHEPVRQDRRDLTLVGMTPDLVYDQLVSVADDVAETAPPSPAELEALRALETKGAAA
jgi:acyl CoA:acetate/3-ketoacid CoA transferase alpha subunit